MLFKISILIPCYQRPKLVVDAINSCLLQTYSPYEILIGDDSPDDLTKQAIEKIQSTSKVNIRYFHNKPSLGQEDNVNMLINAASGDKILLLHDDDLLLENALEILVNCFHIDPTIDVSYGKQYIMSKDGKDLPIKKSESHNKFYYRTAEYEGSVLTPLEASIVQQFPNNCYLMNAELAKKTKYKKVGIVCDFEFGLRIGQTGSKFYFVNEYVARYRVWEGRITNTDKNDSALAAYNLVENIEVPADSKKYKDQWLSNISHVAIGQAINIEEFNRALKLYVRHFRLNRFFTMGGMKQFVLLLLSSPKIIQQITVKEKI